MATGVYFRKLSSAELALEAIQDGKVLYNYETKKIYVDSGTPTATRYKFYDFIGINTATVYSASSTYAIGAYCIYGDLLYRCTTAITVAEAWTIGHWTQVNIMNEITSLNSSLTNEIASHATGSYTVTTTAQTATWQTFTIPFNKTFASVPKVFCMQTSLETMENKRVTSITTTNFVLSVYTANAFTFTGYWMAQI